MKTQKSIKDAVELCALLDKIEAQIYNIGKGNSNVAIGCLLNSPFSYPNYYEDLHTDAMKELHEMLYYAFYLICCIVMETSDDNLLSIAQSSCAKIIEMLFEKQLVIQKAPMVKPLSDLYHNTCSKLQNAHYEGIGLSLEKLYRVLFF